VNDGTYRVLEPQAVEAALQELDLHAYGQPDARTAVKLGAVLGVDAIIVGSVSQFHWEAKKGLAAIGSKISSSLGIGGLDKNATTATVFIEARLIDTTSGEVLANTPGKGESRRGTFKASAFGLGEEALGRVRVNLGSSAFQATILGEATRQSVENVCTQLVAAQGKVTERKLALQGRVADVSGSTIILNLGRSQGLKVGDVLRVERVVREVKDPATGAILRPITQLVGSVTITEADEQSSVGTFEGTGKPAIGDWVVAK